ncbi:hypothetical protein PC9H_003110 [Pleurotus ostreatus]|uniref:Uncharacterized protein n=1 Tax=Pleurotus ostreatus TaxID=5322 RepID=A0A8H7DXP4_PLEOS|nr:uncharacterized protein PC9H_003110 [Pleurotus ostreatus]KAF7436281.1 hypothetical protein PC9H_003110 [Pleurotus ostreatus]
MHKFHCSRTFTATQLTPRSEEPDDGINALADTDLIDTMPMVPPIDQDLPPMPDVSLSSGGRPRRLQRRLPARYRDDPPSIPPTLPPGPPSATSEILAPAANSSRSTSIWFQTPTNDTGIYRLYPRKPTHDPDASASLQDIWDREPAESGANEDEPPLGSDAPAEPEKLQPWSPFPIASIARLMCWFHAGSTQKSNAELDTLVKGVLLRNDFSTEDLRGFSTKAEHNRLDDAADPKINPMNRLFPHHGGWERRSVKIALPAPKPDVQTLALLGPPLSTHI